MTIKKAEYTDKWIEHYIDEELEKFDPVVKGYKTIKLNRFFAVLCWIWLIGSNIILYRKAKIDPAVLYNYTVYLFWSFVAFFMLLRELFRSIIQRSWEAEYKNATKALATAIYGLELLKLSYTDLDSLYKEITELAESSPEKLNDLLVTESGKKIMDDEMIKKGVIDFTPTDKTVNLYVEQLTKLEESCKNACMIKSTPTKTK